MKNTTTTIMTASLEQPTGSQEQLKEQISEHCERLNRFGMQRDEVFKIVEKKDNEISAHIEEIQDLLELKSNSYIYNLKEELREELTTLEATVEKSRELKSKLKLENKAKNQLITELKQDIGKLQSEVQRLETSLRTDTHNMPIILRLMKTHRPGPSNHNRNEPKATDSNGNNDDNENLV